MKAIGKKGKQWIKDRAKLIKEALLEGRIVVRQYKGFPEGKCEDCGEWKELDLDHKKKRSQGGTNDKSNIAWVCRKCHNLRDNFSDPMNKKVKKTKVNWQLEHPCIHCKTINRGLICTHCGVLSLKIK